MVLGTRAFPGVVSDRIKEGGKSFELLEFTLSSAEGFHREPHMSYGLPVLCSVSSFPRATLQVTAY